MNESLKRWDTELTAGKQRLKKVNIRHSIFQGESLSALYLIMVMMPLSLTLQEDNIV